jgi:hypothetical protein
MAQWLVERWGAINTLVKFAAALLPDGGKTLKRETVDRIGDDIAKKPTVDIRAAIWKAVWMLSGDLESNEKCKDPVEVAGGTEAHPATGYTNAIRKERSWASVGDRWVCATDLQGPRHEECAGVAT